MKSNRGFTLIELLIVIGILAILSVAVVTVINPVEIIEQTRDSQRLTEVNAIDSAISLGKSLNSNIDVSVATSTVYISLPDTNINCSSYTTLPALPGGWSYNCVTEANLRKVDGSGWIPLNFSSIVTGSPFSTLPVDPKNTADGGLYYTYIKGSWELTAVFESNKYQDQFPEGFKLSSATEATVSLTPSAVLTRATAAPPPAAIEFILQNQEWPPHNFPLGMPFGVLDHCYDLSAIMPIPSPSLVCYYDTGSYYGLLAEGTVFGLSSEALGFTYNVDCASAVSSDFINPCWEGNPAVMWEDGCLSRSAPTHTCIKHTATEIKEDFDITIALDFSTATLVTEAASPPSPPLNPSPTTTSISPTSKTVGDLGFTLTVNGTNFIASSTVQFAGSNRTTTFVNSTQLTAIISSTDLLVADTFNITVFNPTPGGGTSNTQIFTINPASNPSPTTTSISPISKTIGDTQFTLTVNGTNFIASSTVRFEGSDRATTFVNSTQLTAIISSTDLLVADTFNITVFNPAPGGGTSNAQTFTVNPAPNPAPTTTSISPDSKTTGDSGFTLTVNGTNFIASSTVRFAGSDRVTTFINSNQLTAIIPATDLLTADTFNITVFNPAPGGGTSNAQTLTVNLNSSPFPPYINSWTDLDAVRNNLAGNYVLAANLTPSDPDYIDNFTPLGDENSPFTGGFDGNGYSITGLTINKWGEWGVVVGLFGGTSGATINNIRLIDVNITGSGNTGGLVGWAVGGSIANSYVIGGVAGNGEYLGGLVGYNDGGSITNSYFTTGNLTGDFGGNNTAGGLAGWNSGPITNSYVNAMGDVMGGAAGGLVGWNDSSGSVSKSYVAGTVITGNNTAGGLVGWNYGDITNSYTTGGSVTGHNAGGLAAYNYGSITNSYATENVVGGDNDSASAGGLVGRNSGPVTNSYATGSVTANASSAVPAGLVGWNFSSITNCSWWTSAATNAVGNPSVYRLADAGYGTDLDNNTEFYSSTATVYDQGGANPWDFATPIWYEWVNDYPKLTAQL